MPPRGGWNPTDWATPGADGWRSKLATQVAGATAQQRDLQGPPAARLSCGMFLFSLVSFLSYECELLCGVFQTRFDTITKTHDLDYGVVEPLLGCWNSPRRG